VVDDDPKAVEPIAVRILGVTIMQKAGFDPDSFTAEVRRAISRGQVAA
jgi:hypothetical protein